jgi:hypothetical protein
MKVVVVCDVIFMHVSDELTLHSTHLPFTMGTPFGPAWVHPSSVGS